MTEQEFLQLQIGTVVSGRFHREDYFEIYSTDEMGTAYKGKRYRIYGARQIDRDTNFARISIHNCQFWSIEGRMKS